MPKLDLLSGSYTGPGGEGLKLLSFDTATGSFELVRGFAGTPEKQARERVEELAQALRTLGYLPPTT